MTGNSYEDLKLDDDVYNESHLIVSLKVKSRQHEQTAYHYRPGYTRCSQ